jgi:hypothetical protein
MYLLPGFSRYTFETYMFVQLNSPCRLVSRVLSNFLGFGFRITKKQYFDPVFGVSIKFYLLPGFESYTFETYINVQLDSPCRSVLRVLSKFISQFSINRVFISQKLINFNLFHTKYFWDAQKVLPDHVRR